MSKYPKKLTLRLPPDHPIFNYPDGVRAQIARDWLDVGNRLEQIIKLLEGHNCSERPIDPSEPVKPAAPEINVERLMKRVNEMF